jgi:hypothetical protein
MIRRLVLAGTMLALAAGMTTGAMASDRKVYKSGSHVGRLHHGSFGATHRARRSSRLAGESWYPDGSSQGYQGGFISLGPLGFTAACGPNRRCGSGYGTPVSGWSY